MLGPVQIKNKTPQLPARDSAGNNMHDEQEDNYKLSDTGRSADRPHNFSGANSNSEKNDNSKTQQLSHNFSNIAVHPALLIQPKLSVNAPGDAYEQEADAVADKIMRMPHTTRVTANPSPVKIQRKCSNCGKEEEQEEDDDTETDSIKKVQRKCAACEEEEKNQLQRKQSGNAAPAISANVQQVIESEGQPLDQATRSFMEKRFGFDFGKVQVHNNSLAHQSAKDINALAYTHKYHIAFGAGQYQPKTASGRKLLAHELTHTIQQDENVVRRMVAITTPQTSTARFIIDDDVTPAVGVMTKSMFMSTLNEAVCNAVNEELQGTQYSADNCP